MSLRRFLAAALVAAPVCVPATNNYYETFDGFTAGGVGSTAWGTSVAGDAFGTPFGPATVGFSDVAGYTDDAAHAVQFSSFEGTTMQAINTGSYGISAAPYAFSFALKVVDSASSGSYAQVISLANTDSGFRTIFMLQLLDPDFFVSDTNSYLGILPVNPTNGSVLSTLGVVPGILTGANGFDATGATWNIVIVVTDPANTTLRVWVNPTTGTATPDVELTSFSFGSPLPPKHIGYASFVFPPDTAAGTEKSISVDSVKLFSGAANLDALYQEAYGSYSTLPGAAVADWMMMAY